MIFVSYKDDQNNCSHWLEIMGDRAERSELVKLSCPVPPIRFGSVSKSVMFLSVTTPHFYRTM